jgi:aryl-alcohol dehydrogenase-like predicted oxidoreductase
MYYLHHVFPMYGTKEGTNMERVKVADTDIEVTRIGLGTWAIGGSMWGGTDEETSIDTVRAAIERGITLIDTAPVYGFGTSERFVGTAISDFCDRDDVVLATKVGLNWKDGKIFRDSRPERIREEVKASLDRLQTDHIDIYQVHWPDDETPMRVTAETMKELYDEGLIRAIGVSNFSVEQMKEFRRHAPLHVSQPPLNLFEREAGEDIVPYCREHGITVLSYSGLCRGMLTGKLTPSTTFSGDDLRRNDPKFQSPYFERYLEAVKKLNEYALWRYDRTVMQLAIRWVLDYGHDGVALWGARTPNQTAPMPGAMGWTLDEAARGAIEEIISSNVTEMPKRSVSSFLGPPHRSKFTK